MMEIVRERAEVYRFLSNVFKKEPNDEMIKSIYNVSVSEEMFVFFENENMKTGMEILKNIGRNSKKTSFEKYAEKLRWDYTRMFIGPYKLPCPPYESVYRTKDRLVMQEPTIEVRKKYYEAGLELKNMYKQPDDHIGIEFEFMCYLCEKIIHFLERNEKNYAVNYLEMQKKFLLEHLLQWIPAFCDDVYKNAEENFYKGIAKITIGFLEMEKEQIDCLIVGCLESKT